SYEERPFLFPKAQRREVGWQDRVSVLVQLNGQVHTCEQRVGILAGQEHEVIGEDEADTNHQIHSLGGQQAKAGFAIGTITRLDEPNPRTQLTSRALRAHVGAVVERLVAASANVEDDANVQPFTLREGGCAVRLHELQQHVRAQKKSDYREYSLHCGEVSPPDGGVASAL